MVKKCQSANTVTTANPKDVENLYNKEKKRTKELERELRQKEKALAETAALLVLRKKAREIWGTPRTINQRPGSANGSNAD